MSAKPQSPSLPLEQHTGRAQGSWSTVRDYWTLTKPSINRMCLLMAAGGIALAPNALGAAEVLWVLLGTGLAVGSANTLNMWWERAPDRHMRRTQDRPLAARRISERGALTFGLVLAALAAIVLSLGTNLATTAVGLGALAAYVLIYTPMKYHSPLALLIGALPGAVPPLMGWTAATGTADLVGLALFGTLFVWQMPHFLAIAIFRKHDYAAAGIKTVPVVRGNRVAKLQAIAWAVLLIPVSLALTPLGVTGAVYTTVAAVAGAVFLLTAIFGLRARSDNRWAYQLFGVSLIYLPAIVGAMVIDVAVS